MESSYTSKIKRISILLALCFFIKIGYAQERTIASYYANSLQGRTMSNSDKYDKDSLTCAYNRYPMGTMLKVTHLKNGKSVIVKITDRCGIKGRIDLSYKAAEELGIIKSGIAEVEISKYSLSDRLIKKQENLKVWEYPSYLDFFKFDYLETNDEQRGFFP